MDPFLAFVSAFTTNPLTLAGLLGVVILLILFGWLIPKWTHERVVAAEKARADAWEQLATNAQNTLNEVYGSMFAQSTATNSAAVAMLKTVAPLPDDSARTASPAAPSTPSPPQSVMGG